MKKHCSLIALLSLCLTLTSHAQFGAQGGGSPMDEALAKVFGTNLNLSATMKTEVTIGPDNKTMSITGKIYFANGNSRTEMDMTKITGTAIPAAAIAQMKMLGMDQMVSISLISKRTVYMIYPGFQAYAKMQLPAAASGETNGNGVVTAELGKETVDNHPCVKKQYTIKDSKTGQAVTMTTWNATDLKDSPVKIVQSTGGNTTTMLLTDVVLNQPAASLFTPPANYKAYDDIQTMMQSEMMKKMASGMGASGTK